MSNFKFIKTEIEGVVIVEAQAFGDSRGYFMETYEERKFAEGGITAKFVQDNQSKSSKGVLRGLHFQKTHPQAKLVRVIKGEVYDVAVDLRKSSPTYGKYVGAVLSAENKRQLAEFCYKCDDFYHPEDEGGIIWNDETVGIDWPLDGIDNLNLSEKDTKLPNFSSFSFE